MTAQDPTVQRGRSRHGPAVCHVISSFHPVVGGAETTTERLCRTLASQGARVVVLTRRQPSTQAQEVLDGVVVHRAGIPMSGKVGAIAFGLHSLWLLATRLREYQLLHAQNIDTPLVVALLGKLLFRRSVVATIHREDKIILRKTTRAGRLRLVALRRGVNALVAISPALERQFIEEGIERSRVNAIPNGIDTNHLLPLRPAARRAAREAIGLQDPDSPTVIFVGRLIPHKRVDLLLRAASRMKDGPRFGILIVGDGPAREACESEARRFGLPAVHWAGMQPDVRPYLGAADVFVLPSLKEGLSVALIEAMAMGLAVVVSDIPANRALVEDGVTGFVVPVDDDEALRDRLVRLLSDPELRERLGRAARAQIEREYSIARVAALHADLYNRLERRSDGLQSSVAS